MEPAVKRAKLDESIPERSRLKPSQVSQTSNIFGPIKSDDDESHDQASDEEGSEEEMEAESDASGLEDDDDFGIEAGTSDDDEDEDQDSEAGPDTISQKTGKTKKKNDPNDFALAMQKILSAGLTTSNRKNPILARSLESKKLDEAAKDERLEQKVRKQLTAEKRSKLEKSHNVKVLGETDEKVARTIEKERIMRKVAQKGVVRLFNAIRVAQLAANDGESNGVAKDERTGLKVRQGAGVKKRETQAAEMSKSSFLDLIKSGGRPTTTA